MSKEFIMALEDLGGRLGVDLALSPEGTVAIAVDSVEIGLTFMPDSDEVHLMSIIGALPEEAGGAFHRVLMAANHMGSMTNGAAIGYALEDDLVTLNQRLPAGWLSGARLEGVIENFADLTEIWQQNFTDLQATAARADADAADAPDAPASDDAWIRI